MKMLKVLENESQSVLSPWFGEGPVYFHSIGVK